jgi:dolichol-phosphate mannosyltransferase
LVAAVTGSADLAIGSRYVSGGTTVGWAGHRRLLSRWGNRYAARMLRIPVADSTSGFRAWKAEALAAVDPATCASTGYGFQVEMVWRAVRAGLMVVEIPIRFMDRQRGTSKMSPVIAAEAMLRVTQWGLGERVRRPT